MNSLFTYIKTHYIDRLQNDIDIRLHGVEEPRVDFIISGTQKGGTTALDEYLRNHPEICMATRKEVHFFDREKFFIYPKQNYKEYHEYFQTEPGHLIVGETTPVYMYWYSAPRRIWDYNPKMKFLILLRNPIERAYSHWNMQRERGFEKLPFLKAIKEEENRRKDSLPYQNRHFSYLDRGFYTEQINRLRNYFPMEQILLLKGDDLRVNPESVLLQICQFLGISKPKQIEKITIHSREYSDKMDQKTRDQLSEIYNLEIKQIEKLTGWDCQNWLSPNLS